MNSRGDITLILLVALALTGGSVWGGHHLAAAQVDRFKSIAKTSQEETVAARKLAEGQGAQLAANADLLKKFDDLLVARNNQLQAAANTLLGARTVSKLQPASDRRDTVIDGYVTATAAGLPLPTNGDVINAEVLRLLDESRTSAADLAKQLAEKTAALAALTGRAEVLATEHEKDVAAVRASAETLVGLKRDIEAAEVKRREAESFWNAAKAYAVTLERWAVAIGGLSIVLGGLFLWQRIRARGLQKAIAESIHDADIAGVGKELRLALDPPMNRADQSAIASDVKAHKVAALKSTIS